MLLIEAFYMKHCDTFIQKTEQIPSEICTGCTKK